MSSWMLTSVQGSSRTSLTKYNSAVNRFLIRSETVSPPREISGMLSPSYCYERPPRWCILAAVHSECIGANVQVCRALCEGLNIPSTGSTISKIKVISTNKILNAVSGGRGQLQERTGKIKKSEKKSIARNY